MQIIYVYCITKSDDINLASSQIAIKQETLVVVIGYLMLRFALLFLSMLRMMLSSC